VRNHNPTFGQLIDEHQKRDAVHIAIAPVVAAERLSPGQHIGFSDPGDTEMVGSRAANHIGIVDPFLSAPVYAGERFWMLLYPQTVTGMRHEWEHPAFQAAENSEKFAQTEPMNSCLKPERRPQAAKHLLTAAMIRLPKS
jgi:hypothetical protein